jgi:hypothetical protein
MSECADYTPDVELAGDAPPPDPRGDVLAPLTVRVRVRQGFSKSTRKSVLAPMSRASAATAA